MQLCYKIWKNKFACLDSDALMNFKYTIGLIALKYLI